MFHSFLRLLTGVVKTQGYFPRLKRVKKKKVLLSFGCKHNNSKDVRITFI